MDVLSRGFIFENKIYFGFSPLNLEMDVISAKETYNGLYMIDSQNNLWLCVNKNSTPVITLITDEILVRDVCSYGDDLLILSTDGKLFYRKVEDGHLEIFGVEATFKYLNSDPYKNVVLIDTRGNLWTKSTGLINPPTEYYDGLNLIQYTTDIKFKQAEYGGSNLMCLDDDGNIYVYGSNTKRDLFSDELFFQTVSKLDGPISFNKIAKSVMATVLIDSENNLWICGYYSDFNGVEPRQVLQGVGDVSVGPHHTFVKLLDGTLMYHSIEPWPLQFFGEEPDDYVRGQFNIIYGMTADKLFNDMTAPSKRFYSTKSAAFIKNI